MRRLVAALAVSVLFVVFAGCESGAGIKSLEPNVGNVAGNDDVVIIGNGFKSGMTVHFGKSQVGTVVVESASRIKVKTPPGGEGPVDIIITDESGKTMVLKDGFRYQQQRSK